MTMFQKTDVFVIGGGPAGLAAAIAARKKGFRVAVADGAQPPIDKACGEGLLPDTLAALRELGVEAETGEGQKLQGIRFLRTKDEVAANFPRGHAIGMRRRVLHQKLVEHAEACGVALLWNTPVAGITGEGVVTRDGTVEAQWIVGADGIRSRVRRWSGLDEVKKQTSRYALRRHYRVKAWSDFMEIYWGENGQAYVTPVSEEEVCVVFISRKQGMRFANVEAEFPRLAWRVAGAELASTERGAVTVMQQLRRVHRGRVALVGDASGSVDAISGEGLCLGFRQAAALADALASQNLSLYEAAHRRLARRPMWMGRLMLLLDRHSALRERALRGLASEPELFARLLAVHVGETSPVQMAATGAKLGWSFAAA
jgi:menaquinone-9 beta-reductase